MPTGLTASIPRSAGLGGTIRQLFAIATKKEDRRVTKGHVREVMP